MASPEGVSTVIVQVGPKNAWNDPESGLRYYRWQGRDLPSVTSIRRLAGVPFGLVSWQQGKILDRAAGRILKDEDGKEVGWEDGSLAELTAMLTREKRPRERVLEKNRIKEARKWLLAATTEERDTAAALGTAVHDAAAAGMTPATVPGIVTIHKDGKDIDVAGDDIRPRLRQYLAWRDESGFEPVLVERQVFNLTLGYAGSFDLIARARDGSLWLIDIKTGSGTYSEHLLQLLAYLMAEFVGEDDVRDEQATALLQQVAGVAVLHLSADGWRFIRPVVDAAAWAAFRGLLTFAVWTAAHPDTESWTLAARAGSDSEQEAAA